VATDRPTDTCRPAASAAAAATAAAAGTESLSPPAARVARPTDAETSRGAPPAAAALAGQSDLDHRVMRILPAALRRTNHAGPSLRRSVRMRLFQSAGSRLVWTVYPLLLTSYRCVHPSRRWLQCERAPKRRNHVVVPVAETESERIPSTARVHFLWVLFIILGFVAYCSVKRQWCYKNSRTNSQAIFPPRLFLPRFPSSFHPHPLSFLPFSCVFLPFPTSFHFFSPFLILPNPNPPKRLSEICKIQPILKQRGNFFSCLNIAIRPWYTNRPSHVYYYSYYAYGLFADKPTRGQSCRGLVSSWTGRLAF